MMLGQIWAHGRALIQIGGVVSIGIMMVFGYVLTKRENRFKYTV